MMMVVVMMMMMMMMIMMVMMMMISGVFQRPTTHGLDCVSDVLLKIIELQWSGSRVLDS